MMALISEFLPYIIGAVTAIAGIIGVYIKGKGAGRQEAEHEQMERHAKAREGAKRVEDEVRRTDPDTNRDRLRKHWSR